MSTTDFLPTRDADQTVWLKNFRDKLPAYGKTLGWNDAQVKASQGRCDSLITSITLNEKKYAEYQAQVAATNATLYNVALPFKGFSVTKTLAPTAGLLRIKCDAHEWMRAWIVELDHPYFATTDESGKFSIADVPPGTYELVAWHEVMGEKTAKVTVVAGAPAKVDFQFTATK